MPPGTHALFDPDEDLLAIVRDVFLQQTLHDEAIAERTVNLRESELVRRANLVIELLDREGVRSALLVATPSDAGLQVVASVQGPHGPVRPPKLIMDVPASMGIGNRVVGEEELDKAMDCAVRYVRGRMTY